jgi:hypothetical protein
VEISHKNRSIPKRIERVLKKFNERGDSKIINGVSVKILSGLKKGEVKVKDLGKLQAATNSEFTLLRGRGEYGERVLICGTPNEVGIPEEYIQKEYVWSAHSHPDDTSPSPLDRTALSAFD